MNSWAGSQIRTKRDGSKNSKATEEVKTRAEYDGSIRIGTKIDTRDFAAGLKSMVSEAKTASASVVRLLENIARPEKKIKAFLQGFFQGMKEELRGSKVKENVDGIGKALTGLAKKLVIFQLLKQAFSALMKGVKEAFSSYLAADRNLGSSVRDLQASLKTLQGALASAFAPIVEAVVPWLSTMINWLVAGANAVAQFTASLMGKSVYKKASANIAATGAAAGSAANAVGKLNKKLGAYDDLKVIDQDNGSGGSGGGGGGGSTGSGLEYEGVEIDSGISDFADKVKKAWQEADFTEVGTIVGTKLKDALDNINWEGIKATTEKMAKSVATFLNGFIATPGLFNSIGSTIAEGLNTALAFASTFLNTFDFKQFGKAVTEGLGGFFSTFKWSDLAATLQGWADAGLKFMTGIIQGVDWKNLPQNIIKAIKDFFSGFDFAAHFQAVGEFIGSAVAAGIDLIGAIGKVIGDIGKKIKDYFVEKIQAAGYSSDATLAENGKAIIVGIFNGIVDFFKSIGAWINTNILQPFITGFKSIFGIHSPASNPTIVDLGKNLILGIFQGIIDFFGGIGDWIRNNVLKPFQDGWKSVFGEDGLVSNVVDIGVGLAQDGWKTVSGWFGDFPENVRKAATEIMAGLKKGWDTLTSWFTGEEPTIPAVDAIKGGIKKAWTTLANWFQSEEKTIPVVDAVKGGIKKAWDTLSKWFNSEEKTIPAVDAVKGGIKKAWDTLSGWFSSAAGTIPTVDAVKGGIQKAWGTITEWFTGERGNLITLTAVKGGLQKAWGTITDWFTGERGALSTITAVKGGLEKAWSTITAWFTGERGKLEVVTAVKGGLQKAWGTITDWFTGERGTLITLTAVKGGLQKAWGTITSWFTGERGKLEVVTAVKGGIQKAWGTISSWFKGLGRENQDYVSTAANVVTGRLKKGWSTAKKWFNDLPLSARSTVMSILVGLKKTWNTIKEWFNSTYGSGSTPTVDINSRINSNSRPNARGGTFHGGRHYPISQAAGGGSFSHGTVIVAGEHGAEVAGHINGRTEILNQSQMAAVMYSSVVNGMSAAIGAVLGHMTECTNAVIANIAFLVESMDYVASAMPAYSGISMGFVPDINRTSGVLPSGMSLDALAEAVSARLSGNIQIENVMNMDGRAVYRGMVEIDRQTIRQTGRSAFGG